MVKKLTSRKFLITVISVIASVAVVLQEFGGKAALIGTIISICVPTVTYVITEGVIDAKALKKTVEEVKEVLEEEDANEDSEG